MFEFNPVSETSYVDFTHDRFQVGACRLWLPEAVGTERGSAGVYTHGMAWQREGNLLSQEASVEQVFGPGNVNEVEPGVLECCGIRTRKAAKEGSGVVAPPCFWHIHEDSVGGKNFLRRITVSPLYLTSIPGEVFLKMYLYQLRACVNAGFKAVIAVTGHYGGGEYWMKWHAKLFQKYLASLPIWAMADWEVIDYRDEHQNYKGSHAGVCETAQLLALYPDLPNLDHPYLQEEDPYVGGDLSTVVSRVTPDLGEAIISSQVRNLVSGAEQMLAGAPKDALPFIPIESVDEQWPKILQEGPKLASQMDEQETKEMWETRVEPLAERARDSNGKLPRHVFPDASPESLDSEEW